MRLRHLFIWVPLAALAILCVQVVISHLLFRDVGASLHENKKDPSHLREDLRKLYREISQQLIKIRQEGTWEKDLGDRTYVLHVPPGILAEDRHVPLLLVFHDSQKTAWYAAENQTQWVARANAERFVVAFAQASGVLHTRWSGYTAWMFERQLMAGPDSPFFDEDFVSDMQYVKNMINQIEFDYPTLLDMRRLYAVGTGSGGFFVSDVVVSLGSRLAAVSNCMGGYSSSLNLPVAAERGSDIAGSANADDGRRVPILLVAGADGSQRPFAEEARRVFGAAGYPVELSVLAGVADDYAAKEEEAVWRFLSRHQLPEQLVSDKSLLKLTDLGQW